MTVNELIGSLRMFEMGLRENKVVKKKDMAFKTLYHDPNNDDVSDNYQDMPEALALLTRNFNKWHNKKHINNGDSRYKS